MDPFPVSSADPITSAFWPGYRPFKLIFASLQELDFQWFFLLWMQIPCLSLIHLAALGPLEKEIILLIFPPVLWFDEGGQRERERERGHGKRDHFARGSVRRFARLRLPAWDFSA